ncbi:MAG: hypothetical protein ABSG33_05605 [Candidatus Bathyarchaeia archaeon]
MKMFEAMVFKREIGTTCGLDVKMLDTMNDGIILSIDENLVNSNDLSFIKNFVDQKKLSLLLDSERYFISTNALKPSSLSMWDN